MPQQLKIVGKLGANIGQRFERLNYNFGSGHHTGVLVGHSSGEKFYKYVYIAPDRSTHTVTDPENSNAVTTWADYLMAFHRYRMVDGAAFDVVDQLTGNTVSVVFDGESQSALNFLMEGRNLYGCEIYLKQYRAA